MTKFLTIGEPVVVFASSDADVELAETTNWQMHTAGAELNVAIGIARLGLPSDYISSVGNDPFGEFLTREAKAEGVGTDYIFKDNSHNTGIYFKQNVTQGDPAVFYLRKNSAASNFDISNLDQIDFSEYKIAHISGIFAALSDNSRKVLDEFIVRLKQSGVYITYDPNLRPTLWESEDQMTQVTNYFAKYANIVMPGISEGRTLWVTDDPAEISQRYFENCPDLEYVVVKLGETGAFLSDRTGSSKHVDGFKVDKVVDTVGAGDGFAVGLISALLENLPIEDAVSRATAIGALAVTVSGDNEGYPTREQLEQFMRRSAEGSEAAPPPKTPLLKRDNVEGSEAASPPKTPLLKRDNVEGSEAASPPKTPLLKRGGAEGDGVFTKIDIKGDKHG